MSTISDPNNAVQRIAYLLTEVEDPDDPGMMSEFGETLLAVAEAMASKVRQTNKACKGHVTLKLSLHAYRTKNKEVAIDIEDDITEKRPNKARKRATTVFAGHTGELSTQPVQEEMPLFTKETAKVVEGDKGSENAGKASKKAARAL